MSTASVESLPIRTFRRVYSVVFGFFWYYSPFNKLRKIRFYSDKEMINILLDGRSIARYGDGELRIISNTPSDFYQKNDAKLAKRLADIAMSNEKNVIICFPKPLSTLKGLNLNARLFWISNSFWNRKEWRKIIDVNKKYGNTQITRPYIDYRDKHSAQERYDNLKRAWDGKKICIIEGEKTHLGEGNDLFKNAKAIKRIIAPAKNAYDDFENILKKALSIDKDYLFLIALGPTATVLSYELTKRGRVAFDAGHVDIEYEWMWGGEKKKTAVAGKAVNESGGNMVVRVVEAMKRIKLKDFLAPFIFLLLLIPSWVFKLINVIRRRKLWLVAEDGEARDNGYHFYKYIRECHPKDYCFYAIKTNSAGYKKTSRLGNIIKWGSLKHWLYYMSANLNISSQKSGNPCPIFWYFIHVTLGLYKNRVFLQHGITKDDSKWIYWNKTKFKFFICGAKKEYDYVKEKFGYPEGSVLLTGFPRWDNLKNVSGQDKRKSILIMPTWRNWLGGDRNSVFEVSDFEETDYCKNWNGLLNDKTFIKHIEKEDIKVYFYPHTTMMKYINCFKSKSKSIVCVDLKDDIQKYFNGCDLMITDYSSVAFDFAFLSKPVIYYQFDLNDYRKKHLGKGYFDYEKDGFGPVCETTDEAVIAIKSGLDRKYLRREREFFNLLDNKNSERVYEAIK